ncbi:uncharacterized protein LOC127844378 [Dreissena polymorpha]|uniref:uncharacterized protein LOC127844378 n=1 Tax=Dreissena polymorpha TaxID=45954 RepID=UPI00226555E5|nr:uncharacterized protein LOC127844378 [Dreissena polymorpha]XP_052230483.1 uncharacterized protein LOC127844378 [Dreissena polymorpha]XP_052230484.1 uncharacterized protein LOC127844378 [Dreissena polymorpha]
MAEQYIPCPPIDVSPISREKVTLPSSPQEPDTVVVGISSTAEKEESRKHCGGELLVYAPKGFWATAKNKKMFSKVVNAVDVGKRMFLNIFKKGKQELGEASDGILPTEDEGVMGKKENGFKTNTMKCYTISKINIGKAIIKWCGNESKADVTGLRRLLQAVIDYMATEKDQSVWQNAELDIYDLFYKQYKLTSGDGKCKFYVSYDELDSPIVIPKQRPKISVSKLYQYMLSKY